MPSTRNMHVMITDIHSHLYHFTSSEIEDIVRKCSGAGVGKVIASAYSRETLLGTLPHLKAHRSIYLSLGVHPQDAFTDRDEYRDFLGIMRHCLPCCVAIGEIGYDYHPGNPSRDAQREALKAQISFLGDRRLPLIIHCRNAFPELFMELDSSLGALSSSMRPDMIIHAYSGGYKYFDEAVKRGFYLSFGGAITFRRSRNIRRIAAMAPVNRLLVETDSPFIPPEGAGGRSTPAHAALVVKALSGARGEDMGATERILSNNTGTVFDFKRLDESREEWIKLLEYHLSASRF